MFPASLYRTESLPKIIKARIHRSLRNAQDSRYDGVGHDGPERSEFRFGLGVSTPLSFHEGEELLFPIRVRFVGQPGLEEPEPRPAGVPSLRQAFNARALGFEIPTSLLDRRGEPFAADSGSR